MDETTNTVETMEQESAQADAVQASEPTQESNGAMAISAILGAGAEDSEDSAVEESQDASMPTEQSKPEKVNGGIKGRLLDEHKKGYNAGLTEARKEWEAKEAEYKATIERLQTYELKEKAAQIAREQNVSEAIAMFLAKNGFGDAEASQQTNTKPRDAATGRFVSSKEAEPKAAEDAPSERVQLLFEQAQNISRMSGVDVIELLKSADSDTKEKLESGEMDMYDFYRENGHVSTPKKSPPNIKTNSAGSSSVHLKSMSDDDLDKINSFLMNGGVIDTRK